MPVYPFPQALIGFILLLPFANAGLITARNNTSSCKYIPGDAGWPDKNTWDKLNQTVGGRLIATVPQAAICHIGGYGPLEEDKAACKALQPTWNAPQT